jgi:hypothetical protein
MRQRQETARAAHRHSKSVRDKNAMTKLNGHRDIGHNHISFMTFFFPRMQTLRVFVAAALTLAAIPATTRAQAAPAKPDTSRIDVTGKWNFNIETPVQGTPTVTFTVKGDSIAGQYISNALGTHDFVGTIKGRTLLFAFPAESGGQSFTMAFTAKVDDADSMSGSIDFSGMATGTFWAKRVKP